MASKYYSDHEPYKLEVSIGYSCRTRLLTYELEWSGDLLGDVFK